MTIDQLKPNKVLRGPILPEPVEVIVTISTVRLDMLPEPYPPFP